MKSVYSVIVLAFLITSFTSCSKFFFDGKKASPVMITDMGEMFSTYNLSNSEKEEILRQLNNKALLDEIIRYSKESMWPDAVNTLDERITGRVTMMKYHFYKVATFGNKTIVAVPKEKNTHVPAGFVPTSPMYIIFVSSVVVGK
ncbi:MAG: hypothetical protein QM725_02680 [Lacibacter sp.]